MRGRGVGTRLLAEAARSARDDLDLDHLRLDLRGGTGVEAFSARCGYERVGACPRALKLPDLPDGGPDLRDEVLMWLPLR